MKRFTKHTESWGDFVDVKINAPEILEKELKRSPKIGTVLLGSVTDAYQPLESKYKITRAILEILLKYDFPISILTKSDLVIRDIDLLKRFSDCEVGFTITTLNEETSKDFEPHSSRPEQRLSALKKLHEIGIKTYVFIGPILPGITNLREIFRVIKDEADFVMAEALNTKCGNWQNIKTLIKRKYPHLVPLYESGFNKIYWIGIEKEVKKLSREFDMPLKGFYYHN